MYTEYFNAKKIRTHSVGSCNRFAFCAEIFFRIIKEFMFKHRLKKATYFVFE